MVIHNLKIKEDFAEAVFRGEKTFEVRENDRGYQKGDLIVFGAVDRDGEKLEHEINYLTYEITYVLSGWGIQNGMVVLSIRRAEEVKNDE